MLGRRVVQMIVNQAPQAPNVERCSYLKLSILYSIYKFVCGSYFLLNVFFFTSCKLEVLIFLMQTDWLKNMSLRRKKQSMLASRNLIVVVHRCFSQRWTFLCADAHRKIPFYFFLFYYFLLWVGCIISCFFSLGMG